MIHKVGINGFGHIGRSILRASYQDPDIEIVAVNDITDPKTLAHLLKYDSVFGILEADIQATENAIIVNDQKIKVLTEKGKREHQTMSLSFNVAYGTNYFDHVQIIKPSGEVIEIDPVENSTVMTDRSQMSANIYNPKSKVLTLSKQVTIMIRL